MEVEVKAYPPYLNAVEKIVEDVQENGYGKLYPHEQLKEWLDLEEPKSIDEFRKFQFNYLSAIESLKEVLLMEHKLYLENDRGKGYRVAPPDDQIQYCPEKYIKKAQAQLLKATRVLTFVNEQLLSLDAAQLRMRKMERMAFLRSSFRKRKIPKLKAEVKRIAGG